MCPIINDGNYENRVLIGNGSTSNPAIFLDFGSSFTTTDVLELTLKGNDFSVNRAQDLEIYVATELEGPYAETPYMDSVHGTLVVSNIDVDNNSLNVTVPITGHTFRYIAIRQPNARYLELAEIDAVITRDPSTPTITLVGDAEMTLFVGAMFTDPGATAIDQEDGDLTANIVIAGDIVDTNTEGDYTITYNVTDSDGNAASEVIRLVHIVTNLEAPVLTLLGDLSVTHEAGAIYTDAGVTAIDPEDGDISSSVSIGGDIVNINALGTYTITYDVTDSDGNSAVQVTRTVTVVDTTAPIITLNGDTITTVEVGNTYTDLGASAFDNLDGDITMNITTVNSVDPNSLGTYTITYNVTDSEGNSAVEVSRTVNVVDTTAPIITLNGDAAITLEAGTNYSDAGATAFDNLDGDLTANIVVVNTVDTDTAGEYIITYNVSDSQGNNAIELSRTVTITPRRGYSYTIIHNSGHHFSVAAVPNFDSESYIPRLNSYTLTLEIPDGQTITFETPQPAGSSFFPGEPTLVNGAAIEEPQSDYYVVNVSATNLQVPGGAHNIGDQIVLLNFTVDNTPETGALSIVDMSDPINDHPFVSSGFRPSIFLDVTDNSNTLFEERIIVAEPGTVVTNVDFSTIIPPSISLNGDMNLTLEVGTAYTELGATASDNLDGDISNLIVIGGDSVDTNTLGDYTITYNVSDSHGNVAEEVTRTISVVDTTVPVITLNGDANINVEVGSTYTDAGASALDNYDGDITNAIVIGGDTIDPNTLGSYTITFNVSDAQGNAAIEVTRTVTIVDTTVPVITLNGDADISLLAGNSYNDLGAMAIDNHDGDISSNIIVVNPVDSNIPGIYTITYNVSDNAGNAALEVTRTVTIIQPDITLDVTMFLQGAYDASNGLMRDDLRAAGLIPTSSPYTDTATTEATVFDTTGNNAIVDWVWIELRDKADNTAVAGAQSALLQRDGDVVATDGISSLSFDLDPDDYFVVIKHRNHLGAMSADAMRLDWTSTTSIDFTDSSTATFGAFAQASLTATENGLWTGDANADKEIQSVGNNSEASAISNSILDPDVNPLGIVTQIILNIYSNSDINMDGVLSLNDDNAIIPSNILSHNANSFTLSSYIIEEQLPEN